MIKAIEIERPVSEIFDFLTDGRNSAAFLGEGFTMTPLDGEQFEMGKRVQCNGSFLGFNFKMLMEVMSFRPNKVVRLRSIDQGQFNSEVVWRLEPLGENKSRVALELNILPANGFLGALIAPFVPQIESRVVKFVEQTLRRLKKVSEKEMVVSAA